MNIKHNVICKNYCVHWKNANGQIQQEKFLAESEQQAENAAKSKYGEDIEVIELTEEK